MKRKEKRRSPNFWVVGSCVLLVSAGVIQAQACEELFRAPIEPLPEAVSILRSKGQIRDLSRKLAHRFHERWRETRVTDSGEYAPRWKPVVSKSEFDALREKSNQKDQRAFRLREDGGEKVWEIDIANLSFDFLSHQWQRENLQAARVAVRAVLESLVEGREINVSEVDRICQERIHPAWQKRNTWINEKGEKVIGWRAQHRRDFHYLVRIERLYEKVKGKQELTLLDQTLWQELFDQSWKGIVSESEIFELKDFAEDAKRDRNQVWEAWKIISPSLVKE